MLGKSWVLILVWPHIFPRLLQFLEWDVKQHILTNKMTMEVTLLDLSVEAHDLTTNYISTNLNTVEWLARAAQKMLYLV